MADKLITREDIVRGKKNFDAFDKYLDGAASEQVSLPSGKKIKTRAGVEAAIIKSFPDNSAAYKSTGTTVGSVPVLNTKGFADTGFGGAVAPTVYSDSLVDLNQTAILKISDEQALSVGAPLPEYGKLFNMMGFTSTSSQVFFNDSNIDCRMFVRNIRDHVASSWAEVYHSCNKKPYTTTTATSANVVVTPTGELQRSTSSAIFKKDIADISIPDYRAALKAVRPVSYRSTDSTSDRTDWSWYSFIAEEIAAIDPRLAQMDSVEFFEDTDEEGKPFINSRELPEGEYAANGINTNGIVALMVHINQQMLTDIETLESEKTQMKSRMTKLEKRLDALEQSAQPTVK